MGILIRFTVLLSFFLILSASSKAQEGPNYLYEQKIKAAIVYNFLKFTNWPDDTFARTNGKINVCLFGGDPFDGYLYPLEGKTAQQHPITIIQVHDIRKTAHCSLIFVHRNEAESLTPLLHFLKGRPVLTVSDIEAFAQQGGMIEMAKENEQINLYINDHEANADGLRIAKDILKLARLIPSNKG